MDIETPIKQQEATAADIQRLVATIKKAPLERRTAEYYGTKEQELRELWKVFNNNDNIIRREYGNQASHAYFVNDYYGRVGKIYNEALDECEQKRQAIIAADKATADVIRARDIAPTPAAQINVGQETRYGLDAPHAHPSEQIKTASRQHGPVHQSHTANPLPTREVLNKIKKQEYLIRVIQESLHQLLQNTTTRTPEYYASQLQSIDQHWSTARKLHAVIFDEIEDLDSNHYDMGAYLKQELEINEGLAKLRQLATRNSPVNTMNSQSLKLPKIELPKFDGDYTKWRQFRDLFEELVDKQPISQCEKMWYLKSSLGGEAANLIHHFSVSHTDYQSAWKMVRDRYQNQRLIVNAILKKLLAQPECGVENATTIKQLHDTTQECLLSLNNLGIDTTNWDPLALHILVQKLHKHTHTMWEQSLVNPRELPTIQQFLKFLELRFQTLEAMGNDSSAKGGRAVKVLSTTIPKATRSCIACKASHPLYICPEFLKLTPSRRLNLVQKCKRCVNCLRDGHMARDCTSRSCTKCTKNHNTLLHLEMTQPEQVSARNVSEDQAVTRTTSASSVASSHASLISTIRIALVDKHGIQVPCRAMLDSGSQTNLITESMAKKLGLARRSCDVSIEGVGNSRHRATSRINVQLTSIATEFTIRLEAQVLPKIVSKQPSTFRDTAEWKIPKNIPLADPMFYQPGGTDLLIGAGLFYSSLCIGQIKLGDNAPVIQNTLFGWIVGGGGRNEASNTSSAICTVATTDDELNTTLEKFWQLEDCNNSPHNFTAAEQRCETHFLQNTQYGRDRRFIVKLPFQGDPSQLGETKEIALQRLWAVERKFKKNAEFKQEYVKFMQEYQQLGHMTEVSVNQLKQPHFFLPHHAVIKPDSTTTKLRVVFDASAKSSSNLSLNDLLATGPVLQQDVFTTILQFRVPRYAFTADIAKMYRQIWVAEEDRQFQLIWWREDSALPLKCYQLTTLTYGTTSAPYLAIKCLHKLAEDNENKFPLAAKALKSNFYMDDLLGGTNEINTAIETQSQLQALLQSAGFHLRKWSANDIRLLNNLEPSDREVNIGMEHSIEESTRIMGLTWLPTRDELRIQVGDIMPNKVTKRTVMSDIAKLFDPLGFVAPVIVKAKIFMQQLWKLKLDWDAALPQDLHTTWTNFRDTLPVLRQLSLPRHVLRTRTPKTVEIHIFADASEAAYGAVAYVRTVDANNVVGVRLLCAKTKVAPTKQVSLPRLELCAAKLAIDLAVRLQADAILPGKLVYFWSDSTAVLGWIRADSSNYHTFVANRISAIQRHSTLQQWRHVSSEDNPADLLSRGTTPEGLVNNNFWLYGPRYLHGAITSWPLQPPINNELQLERRQRSRLTVSNIVEDTVKDILDVNHHNSFRRLQRIMAYVLRFIKRLKTKALPLEEQTRVPTAKEMEGSLLTIIKIIQTRNFTNDIKQLKKYKAISGSSALSSLTPFLDKEGILRVGGRLEASKMNFDAKHPMLLPYPNEIVKLLVHDVHKENMHIGVQSLMAHVRQRFWPIRLKNLARSVVMNCLQCARAKPQLYQQLMGNLPEDRVQPARPFVNTGVDFFGPIWIHVRIRGKRPLKAYVAVFCCFSTKAVHLELVSDLSTEAFIGALRRFMARRGHCSKIYCDNATNFIGAKNRIAELQTILYEDQGKHQIAQECSKKGIEFCFIPPRAPHFGGLWEAAVKSAKNLLQTSLASANLTHEEMETVIIEAEAILNSRPITPLSNDPNDLTALTPGHFLIGEPITTTIDPNARVNTANTITRWKLVAQLKIEFWRRWSAEYLSTLQHRHKWRTECHKIRPGAMVLIKEDNLPPLKWMIGRIIKVIRGDDGLVRVVDVRTGKSIFRRPIHKLAPLPIETEAIESAPEKSKPEDLNPGTAQKEKAECEDATPHPRKRRRQTSNSATLLFLTCLFLPLAALASIEVKPFTTHPSIFFEGLGSADVVRGEWRLVTYINMQPYWDSVRIVEGYPIAIRKSCQALSPTTCTTIISLVERLCYELKETNELLKDKPPIRAKRGALNVVGNIARTLFGVLDSDYAEQTANVIERIHSNEEQITTSIQNQTSFLDRTLSIMKKNQVDTAAEFQNIQSILNATSNQVLKAAEEVHLERHESAFNHLLSQFTLTFSYLSRLQDSFIDILTDTHHGKINPELLAPHQLHEEVIKIKTHLPNNLHLPATEKELLKLYNIMTIQGRVVRNFIICRLLIPLTTAEKFEILRMIPLPWKTEHGHFQIKPLSTHLIVNLHRDKYYPLSTSEFKECSMIDENEYLCYHQHPLYMKGAKTSACEIALLNNDATGSICKIAPAAPGPHWIPLHKPNTWLYAVDHESTLNAVCGSLPEQVKVHHSGVLVIGEDCIVKQPLLTIQGTNMQYSTNLTNYIASLNSETMTTPIISNTSSTEVQYQSAYHPYINELNTLQREIAELRINLPHSTRPHDVHHFVLGYTCLVVILCFGLIYCRKWYMNRTPVPSNQVTQDDNELRFITVHGSQG